jgi:hypothetical protein
VAASLACAVAEPAALDATSVAGGVAVNAVQGPTTGCYIAPVATALIVDLVGTAQTSATATSVQIGIGSIFNCGPLSARTKVSVNCLGGGACSWTGFKF